jgi:uncharacterized membrane protein
METVLLILLCAVFYAVFEIFAGLAGGKINDWLAAVLYNGIGTVIPLIVYLSTTAAKGKTTIRGAVYASLAGVGIMLFSVLLARVFNKGGNLSYVIPTVYGIAIVLSSMFGYIFLKDKMTTLQALGLGFIVVGVVCIIYAKAKG